MLDKTQNDQTLFKNKEYVEEDIVDEMVQEDYESENDFENDVSTESYKNSLKKKKMRFSTKKAIKNVIMKAVAAILFCVSAILLLMCGSNFYQNMFNPDGYTGFFGIGEAIVASNSMDHPDSNPRIQINDLVFYTEADVNEVSVGDIIIYKKEDINGESTLIIHRVTQINNDSFVAKGDNNEIADDEMPASAIIGKYMFKIDKIGAILRPISSTKASIIVIAILVFVFVLRVLIYLWYKKSVIKKISLNENTRCAIDYFFDI